MSLSDEQYGFAKDIYLLFGYLLANGCKFTGEEWTRTAEQQAIYLKTGKSKTANSKHLEKKAFDINIWIDGELTRDKAKLQHIGDYWEKLNPRNRWGGNFKSFLDTPHFERQ